MRRHLAALLFAVTAALPVPVSPAFAPAPAESQEAPTMRLTVSSDVRRQMQESPGELSWSDLPEHLAVEFTSPDALPMERVPVRLVAVAVHEGETLGRAATTPSVARAGESLPASRIAGGSWPPAEEWFPGSAWRPDEIRSPDSAVTPEAGAVVSGIDLPSDAGGVVLFAAPAADALVQRFRTVPVVITTRPTSGPAGAESAGMDTTGAFEVTGAGVEEPLD